MINYGTLYLDPGQQLNDFASTSYTHIGYKPTLQSTAMGFLMIYNLTDCASFFKIT